MPKSHSIIPPEVSVEPTILYREKGRSGHVYVGRRLLGRAFPAHGPYFTATPSYPDLLPGEGASIGTRYTTPERAALALREFGDRFPPDRIQELGEAALREQQARYGYGARGDRAAFYGVLRAVEIFKRTYPRLNT